MVGIDFVSGINLLAVSIVVEIVERKQIAGGGGGGVGNRNACSIRNYAFDECQCGESGCQGIRVTFSTIGIQLHFIFCALGQVGQHILVAINDDGCGSLSDFTVFQSIIHSAKLGLFPVQAGGGAFHM